MKIVLNADGVIWNEYLPVLEQFRRDVIVVKYASAGAFRPAHEGFTYLLVDPHKAEGSGKDVRKEALCLCGGKLLEYIGDDNDVLLLTDNDPVSFYPYEFLKEQFRTRRIHLLSCLPFSYESRRRKAEIREALSDLNMAHSLCLVELDSLLRTSDTQETMGRLQIRIRKFLQELLIYAAEQLSGMDEFFQYLFDPESGRYVEADLTNIIEELEKQAGDKKREAAAEEPKAKETEAEVHEDAAQEPASPDAAAEDALLESLSQEEALPAEAEKPEEADADETSNIGKAPQPKEVDITYKRPVQKPSFFERLFGKRK